MKDDSLSKLGGACSILVGVAYLLMGITYLLQPAELQAGGDPTLLWPTLAQSPPMHTLQQWAGALAGVFAIAAVLAISEVVRPANEGWVRWTSALAYLGYAVLAISSFRALALAPTLAEAYMTGDASTQAAIVVAGSFVDLEPQGWLGFGATGLWMFVVNLLALGRGTWPKTLAYVGIAGGIFSCFVVGGMVLGIPLLIAIAGALGGVIVAPIWFIWMGLRLRQANL